MKNNLIKSILVSICISSFIALMMPLNQSALCLETENENSNKLVNFGDESSKSDDLLEANKYFSDKNDEFTSEESNQQRPLSKNDLLPILFYLYSLESNNNLNNINKEDRLDTNKYDWKALDESENENLFNNDDDLGIESNDDRSAYLQKRSRYTKKESPIDQRNRDIRRQQAARWDIGFGKRAGFKSKSFMDALYGKRSNLKHSHSKINFGRKQQWDVQYGK